MSLAAAGKVHVVNVGCVENALEASRIQNFFQQNNWQLVNNAEDADLVLVNTCGMSDAREGDSLRLINKMCRQVQDSSKVVVTGCLAEINPQAILENCSGTNLVSPKDPKSLEALIQAKVSKEQVAAGDVPSRFMRARLRNLNRAGGSVAFFERLGIPYPSYLGRVFSAFEQPDWFFVQIGTGCIYRCSYCAIRLAKGSVRSLPVDQIIQQVRQGVQAGHKRIVLVGDDTSSYGLDIGLNFGDLLCSLVALPGDFSIYVRNLHPAGLLRQMDLVEKAVATGKIGALTVPVQSGSNRILKEMRRHHKVEELTDALRRLSSLSPSTLLLTHILVGFPGETREEFKQTLKLIGDFPFDGVAPDCFSPRRGTEAAEMDSQISPTARTLRYWRAILTIIYRVYFNSLRWKRPLARDYGHSL